MTLSYCWGPDATKWLTTTKATLDKNLCDGLPYHLPKTLEDAVTVCRKIGIRFLWVDALCIIQDDETDMLDQISNMGSIYKNSTITIAVASAGTVSDGFLINLKVIQPVAQLPLFMAAGSPPGTIFLRERNKDPMDGSSEPWFSRGWTLQELVLSPRIILFDSCQIALKCHPFNFEPVLPNWLEIDSGKFKARNGIFGLEQTSSKFYTVHFTNQDTLGERSSMWQDLVKEYSRRNLSYLKDRLPALAGVASELAKH